ncbi:MAG: succinylglutamate desuccinylase/aspartoacylase family protein [Halalkalicoccus sp.]
MSSPRLSRRALLEAAGGALALSLAGCTDAGDGIAGESGDEEPVETERETHPLLEGTEYETTVHVLTAGEGPTGMVLGGVHGNEIGGIEAARIATEYELSCGRLVVIPETNRPAVEEGTRHGPDGDLNRQFPIGEEPTTELARALWAEIESVEPDCLIDMHTSRGIIGVDPGAVGQMIFPSPVEGASEDAAAVAEYVNDEVMAEFIEENPEYAFRSGEVSEVEIEQSDEVGLMLTMKAGADLGIPSWITEVTYNGLDVDQQTFLHDRLTTRLLAINGIGVESPLDGESLE